MANRVVLAYDPTYGFPETILSTDNIDMQSSGKVVNLAAATTAGDAASYGQSGLSLAGLTLTAALAMGGFQINNVANPTSAQDAATKSYVDGLVQGITWKNPAIVVATTNQALTGLPTVDSITLTTGQRILLTAQTTATQNGVYTVAAGAWTRSTDMAAGSAAGADALFVEEGTVNADTAWVCTNDTGSDIVGTNSLVFVQFTSATGYTAGNGLTLTGHSFSVKAGDGIETVSNTNSTNVRLDATAPGIQFTGAAGSGALQVKNDPNGGLTVAAAGEAVKPDATTSGNPTVAVGANGLRVIGLPSLFNINSVAVSANVTAANLGTLTAGVDSDADILHSHMSSRGAFITVSALAKADPVYWSSTNDQVDKALGNTDAKSFAVGVAMSATLAAGSADCVFDGLAPGILTGATAGAVYWLAPAGGMVTTVPGGGGNRIMVMGQAKNATDFFVKVRDYGKKF